MRFIYCVLFSFFFHFTTSAQEPQIVRIDPGFASGAPVSQVFEKVKFIPLETTKESLFGTVNQLEISPDYFVILDFSTNAVLIFNANGTFHAKITPGNGNIYSVQFEKEENRIRVLSTNNKQLEEQIRIKVETDYDGAIALLKRFSKVNYYDTDGKPLKVATSKEVLTPENLYSIKLPGGFSFSNFAVAGENMSQTTAFELNLYRDGQLFQSYFPYNTKQDIARYGRYLSNTAGFSRSQDDTVVYFTRPLDYSIFELTPFRIIEKYRLIFTMKNTVPPSFFTDNISQNDRRTFFRDNPSMVTGLSDIHERKGRLFFRINNNDWGRSRSANLLYHLRTGRLISLSQLSPDSLSSFLPVTDRSFAYESFKATDETHFYTYISSLRMFGAIESNLSKNIPPPSDLDEYFKRGNKKDNPVIVQLTPIKNPS